MFLTSFQNHYLEIYIYLASPASDYTTGQTFFVDGGFMAGSQW